MIVDGAVPHPIVAGLLRAQVVRITASGLVAVQVGDGSEWLCEVVRSVTGVSPHVGEGDAVLVWSDAPDERQGIVLGVLSRHAAPDAHPPDTLVLEARESLTLRVGEGSITIRKDGKILIKGKDLVSQAKRSNRIKGGSVAIN